MPELPEVETFVRLLRPKLVGRTITGVHVDWARTLAGLTPARFTRAVCGACIGAVWRRAKYAVLDLQRAGAPAGFVVGHLRMTGRWQVEPPEFDPGPHRRVSLALDDGRSLHFIDARKFGRLWFTPALEPLLGALGPEPLGAGFTPEWLYAELHARRRALKPLLLDQTFLAGLGNIYVDEALHAAGLHPLRAAHTVDRAQARRLYAAVRTTLRAAVAREGSSFDSFYRTPEGRPGRYQHKLRVYGREGQPCLTCGTAVVRLVVGQRGTHVCRKCQPPPRGR